MGPMAIPCALTSDLEAAGYYPQLAGALLTESLFGEDVLSHLVHMDTHVDLDSIHRHVTAFALTDTRLLIVHVDDEPQQMLGRQPRGVTSSEAIELEDVRSILISRTYAEPAAYRPGDRPEEIALTIGWGSVDRLDLIPETCADPDCEGDHGYSGTRAGDDVTLRIAAQAEGRAAVDQAERFAMSLRKAVHLARRRRHV